MPMNSDKEIFAAFICANKVKLVKYFRQKRGCKDYITLSSAKKSANQNKSKPHLEVKPPWVTKYNPIFGVYVPTGLRQSWTEKQTCCLQTQS